MFGGVILVFQNESSCDFVVFVGQDVEGVCGCWIVYYFQVDVV